MKFVMIALALGAIWFYFYKLNFGKRTAIYVACALPFLFFNTNMINEAMTTDEWQYISAFMKMSAIERGSILWLKGTYQYRISEMIGGTICKIAIVLHPEISEESLAIFYKWTHWLTFFFVLVGIAYVWCKIIGGDSRSVKTRVAWGGIV